jgi:capsular polysaccharide biosynthesis protein
VPIYSKDAIYSPKAINYIRDIVLKSLNISYNKKNRKIYISRKNSDYRQLLNSTEIENILVKYGFEILCPEYLSFAAQVEIFSQAKIIIGQSGAGMANFIFVPKGCKILMMVSDAPQTNLHLFDTLAKSVDIDIDFIIGEGTSSFHKNFAIHKDFYITTEILCDYLKKMNL